MKQDTISAQVSLYPLRQPHLGPAIDKAAEVLRASGVDLKPGTMSTILVGESERVFDGLKAAFQSAAAAGDVVMVVSFSNCCPVAEAEPHVAPGVESSCR
jgi:uncharacterized protein YqgV (UPF0045/DUF77 family)